MPRPIPQGKQKAGARQIPAMEKILSSAAMTSAIERFGRDLAKRELVRQLELVRRDGTSITIDEAASRTERALRESFAPSLRRVVNGTGILIHTNLGRSPIDPALWARASGVVSHYSNLEFDLERGERGRRDEHLARFAREVFGCESAILTNNNAAAVLLVLATVAPKKEVIVSRGELVEIGGGFRIPEVIEQGGATLREIGTTNRTRKRDYAAAASKKTGAILRVSRSNFEIVGFTESAAIEDLVEVAREKRVPVVVDEGSGRIVDLAKYGFAKKATIAELFAAGVDVVTCSTDKLLGATQGGLILGSRDVIQRCVRHPLMRAVRAGKESYSVIAETLQSFASAKHESEIPIYRMLAASLDELRRRASALSVKPIATRSALGGGTTPVESIESVGFAIAGKAHEIHTRMLRNDPPIVGVIQDGRYIIDLRTVLPEEDGMVREAIGNRQ
ncbi:MAG TPA: L-seryl-tRNA(Sec) selenium transferase [Thermoanaerobaculia bacterium]